MASSRVTSYSLPLSSDVGLRRSALPAAAWLNRACRRPADGRAHNPPVPVSSRPTVRRDGPGPGQPCAVPPDDAKSGFAASRAIPETHTRSALPLSTAAATPVDVDRQGLGTALRRPRARGPVARALVLVAEDRSLAGISTRVDKLAMHPPYESTAHKQSSGATPWLGPPTATGAQPKPPLAPVERNVR